MGDKSLAVMSTLHALGETMPAVPTAGDAPKLGRGMGGRERYAPRGSLGEGGMGMVERVWDADLMRELAVKRLRPGLREDARLVGQFLWEARVTALLDHPNIVPLHDLGLTEDHELYFTMKRVRGRSLADALDAVRAGGGETLPVRRRLGIFLSVCNAIAFAHSRGVLHRDLKPANVMLGEHGEVTVMDWGLALPLPTPEGDALREMLPAGEHGSSSGTPAYMSPEQARGEPLDARSDVYTLGVMLYELVSLRLPYEERSLPALLAKISAGEARPLHVAQPGASRSIAAVVERAMAHEKSERYPSVDALARDVETVLDGRTPTAEDAGYIRRFARFYGSRSALLGKMRVIDWELFITGGFLYGGALGAWLADTLGPFFVPLAVAGTLAWVFPTWRWYRLYRGMIE